MKVLPVLDFTIIGIYLIAMVLVGFYFSRKNKNAEQFTVASGLIPGWAIGLSIYATFLSSNTFLGVPGKAYGGNWNAFVFSLSMPIAAWIAVKYFIPFYRNTGNISAYTHFEKRFGPWARVYAVICFLLTQIARMGSVFFGIALSLQALTGLSMKTIMVVMGISIILYTVSGGIKAVIWTEVVQAIIKTLGALLIIYLVVSSIPGGFDKIVEIGKADHKFSLGSFSLNLTEPTFWVILFYGFFINLNNFGMDQNYIQRYHAAKSTKQAAKSVWLCVGIYVPASFLFFVIGSCLYAYYSQHPDLILSLKHQVAIERLPATASATDVSVFMNKLTPADYGDKIMPHFMVTKIPAGLVGIIVAAILSAAMSTISSGMNSSATVFTIDIYKRYFKPQLNDKNTLNALHIGTVLFGFAGMAAGIAMIGVKSILDLWWQLSGIFAAGMLGLFLLGIISRQTRNHEAIIASIIGVLVILWLTFPTLIPEQYAALRSTLNTNMIIVAGTLAIFLTGILLTKTRQLTV
ncbi:sodium:solute symporter [Mucilaginibacter gossypii]|uniref:sodium:solute symporter n=1 Tax=Mucilaginibacter gossypii TaxID=551996 RepID=UPI000DCB9520|nr:MULTISPECIES: sodium:solute symporter [Mucilaginibacter]QTE37170.1 sodium:solute symporter [Mucilaginibacter gossypii]RAV59151.1 sodium:solute symporter [Mucilaginibacter rubeus]